MMPHTPGFSNKIVKLINELLIVLGRHPKIESGRMLQYDGGGSMMKKIICFALILVFMFSIIGCTDEIDKEGDKMENTIVVFETSLGNFEVELYADKAPVSVENFLGYVKDGFYDGLIFHRVIDGFMVQGGGFEPDMSQKQGKAAIKNEAGNGLKNEIYTVAMARTNVVDSATSQFFVNAGDNAFLDHKDETPQGFGYAVFGKVAAGIDTIDKIKAVKTTTRSGFQDVPVEPVVINKAYVKKYSGERK